MTANQEIHQYQSCLLRLWQVKEADGAIVWRGEIESIQTGQTWQFDAPQPMLQFLQAQMLEVVAGRSG